MLSGVVLFCVRFDVVLLCSCVGFVGSSWGILSGEVVKIGSSAVVCVRGVSWGLEKNSVRRDSSVVHSCFRCWFRSFFFFPQIFLWRSVGLRCGYSTVLFSWLVMESRFRFDVKFKSRVECRRFVFVVVPKTVLKFLAEITRRFLESQKQIRHGAFRVKKATFF